MSPTTSASGPEPVHRFRDPIAVALGNASLFGAGYALLGRWGHTFITATVTVVLLVVFGVVDGAGWWLQSTLALWWVSTIAHGWYLARFRGDSVPPAEAREPESAAPEPSATYAPPDAPGSGGNKPSSPRRQRLIALAVAVPVLLIFGTLRVDAWRIEQAADEAHLAGKCGRTLSRLDGLWFGHRFADAPLTDRADTVAEACELLRRAEREADEDRLRAQATLKRYLAHPAARWDGAPDMRAGLLLDEAGHQLKAALKTGDIAAMDTGFEHLVTVLQEIPKQRGDVDRVLRNFLDGLPTKDSCNTARVTGRMDDRLSPGHDLDRALETVDSTEPKAIVGCGDDLLEQDQPHEAKERYQQLLSEYPKHKQVAAAEKGLVQAKQGIELENVTELLQTPYGGKPAYCKNPAPYSGAKPYRGNGPHPALLYGKDKHRSKLSSSWKADGAADAVLVICAGSAKHGTVVETCPYTPFGETSNVTYVSFHKRKIPVTVYEVRTGKVVEDGSIQIGGESCPATVRYEYPAGGIDPGPDSDMYVKSSKSDIRDAYRDLIDP